MFVKDKVKISSRVGGVKWRVVYFGKLVYTRTLRFLPSCHYANTVYTLALWPSVCPLQGVIVPTAKRKITKLRPTIDQGLLFSNAKDLDEISIRMSPRLRVPNANSMW